MDLAVIIALQKVNEQKMQKLEILSSIRDQRIKSREQGNS